MPLPAEACLADSPAERKGPSPKLMIVEASTSARAPRIRTTRAVIETCRASRRLHDAEARTSTVRPRTSERDTRSPIPPRGRLDHDTPSAAPSRSGAALEPAPKFVK